MVGNHRVAAMTLTAQVRLLLSTLLTFLSMLPTTEYSPMAMTLLEASKLNDGEVVRNGVIRMFAQSSPLLAALPFINVNGGSYSYLQQGKLPGVAFRAVNQAFDESVGVIVPQTEALRIAGGDLDVDRAIIQFHGEEVRAEHEAQKVQALGLYIGKKIIKGDSSVDPREFDGLQLRLTGSQVIDAGSTDGGDPLTLAKLDELIDAVLNPTHLLMSKAMRRRLTASARDVDVAGHVTYSKDEFGNRVTQYNDIPIIEVDDDELGARILAFDEVGAGGATATATSIYCVSFGEGRMVGLQNGVMDVRDLGEIDAKPVWRTRVDWNVGLATLHGRCAARLRGISDAAVAA